MQDNTSPASISFERSGRSWTALIVLAVIWGVVILGYVFLDAAGWIVGGLLLLTLPAAWDFATARSSGLTLDDTQLRWFSGRMQGALPRDQLDHVRLDRRLDLSMRLSLVTPEAKRIRLPQECLPPLDRLESALTDAGIRIERHPFSLL